MIPYLILHKVRGEPAYDIAHQIQLPGGESIWIVTTSGHRAYPFRSWALEDLMDTSDINNYGNHDRPASFDHTLPADWPEHYQAARPIKARVGDPVSALADLGLL